jgi:hypothetical protein
MRELLVWLLFAAFVGGGAYALRQGVLAAFRRPGNSSERPGSQPRRGTQDRD